MTAINEVFHHPDAILDLSFLSLLLITGLLDKAKYLVSKERTHLPCK